MIVDNDTDSPVVSKKWLILDESERLEEVKRLLIDHNLADKLEVTRAEETGYVYFKMIENLGSSTRGTILLDLEINLKKILDEGITVWCEPMGDRSALRKLRGIQIKDGVGNLN
jgi:hypothetical protein